VTLANDRDDREQQFSIVFSGIGAVLLMQLLAMPRAV
jgi:hypothetical protein